MRTQEQRRAELKELVELGCIPQVANCTAGAGDDYTMGDLQALGWMTKTYTHDAEGEVDGWERYYTGPQAIYVDTCGAEELEMLMPGETLY
jgi:hypothetical protein